MKIGYKGWALIAMVVGLWGFPPLLAAPVEGGGAVANTNKSVYLYLDRTGSLVPHVANQPDSPNRKIAEILRYLFMQEKADVKIFGSNDQIYFRTFSNKVDVSNPVPHKDAITWNQRIDYYANLITNNNDTGLTTNGSSFNFNDNFTDFKDVLEDIENNVKSGTSSMQLFIIASDFVHDPKDKACKNPEQKLDNQSPKTDKSSPTTNSKNKTRELKNLSKNGELLYRSSGTNYARDDIIGPANQFLNNLSPYFAIKDSNQDRNRFLLLIDVNPRNLTKEPDKVDCLNTFRTESDGLRSKLNELSIRMVSYENYKNNLSGFTSLLSQLLTNPLNIHDTPEWIATPDKGITGIKAVVTNPNNFDVRITEVLVNTTGQDTGIKTYRLDSQVTVPALHQAFPFSFAPSNSADNLNGLIGGKLDRIWMGLEQLPSPMKPRWQEVPISRNQPAFGKAELFMGIIPGTESSQILFIKVDLRDESVHTGKPVIGTLKLKRRGDEAILETWERVELPQVGNQASRTFAGRVTNSAALNGNYSNLELVFIIGNKKVVSQLENRTQAWTEKFKIIGRVAIVVLLLGGIALFLPILGRLIKGGYVEPVNLPALLALVPSGYTIVIQFLIENKGANQSLFMNTMELVWFLTFILCINLLLKYILNRNMKNLIFSNQYITYHGTMLKTLTISIGIALIIGGSLAVWLWGYFGLSDVNNEIILKMVEKYGASASH
ncbi:MAG: hypothetical protein G8345_04685 [Magnetococcales bacterium]|nr:hypothetical protein [Magnetococcales bacterium]NGZ26167.1 hypothetical protein [Magnetococcales bacterium]